MPFISFFFALGCAGMKLSPPPMATIPGVSGHFWIGQIVDIKEGKALSFEELIERIVSKDLIFIGEVHDNPEHHLIHVQILQALINCCSPLTVAMEFFQLQDQELLDRYLQGGVTESQFLKGVDWNGSWGYGYHLYRPLMLLARDKRIQVLAVNAPKEIVRKVARTGLEGLDVAERNQLPEDIDLSNEAHRAYLRQVHEQRAHQELGNFEYFYEAQCVWEETMANNIANHSRNKRQKLVVFTGNGHIINKFGIPDRTIRRHPASMVTILPYPLTEKTAIEKGTADYLWLTPKYPHRVTKFHEK